MRFQDDRVPGYPLPVLPGHASPGRLERVLRAGGFAITAELEPPDSADPEEVYRRARVFDGWVDAINATDGSGANCHMSSLAVCSLLTRAGYSPVMQISCRDNFLLYTSNPAVEHQGLNPRCARLLQQKSKCKQYPLD